MVSRLRHDYRARQRRALATSASACSSWPTPSAALTNDDEGPETFKARQAAQKARGINGNGAGMPLTAAAKDWPTPASRDWRAPNSQDSQDSQDKRNADSARGQQLPNFVEHVLAETWGTPSTMDARGRTYTRDGGRKGEERPALAGQAESLSCQSIPQVPGSASDGPPSSPTSPSSLRLSPEFVEWLMGWPPGWTIPSPGSMRPEPTAFAPPATAWSHWLQRQRSWLSALSWSYAPPPEAEPPMRQMELI